MTINDLIAFGVTYRDLIAFLSGVVVMAGINWLLDHGRQRRLAREAARIRAESRR